MLYRDARNTKNKHVKDIASLPERHFKSSPCSNVQLISLLSILIRLREGLFHNHAYLEPERAKE